MYLTRKVYRNIIFGCGVLVLASIAALLAGCTVSQDQFAAKSIMAANGLQDAAAHAYDDAVAQEQAAGKLCNLALCPAGVASPLNPVGCPLPAPNAAILESCAKAGAPIPYNPDALARVAGPLNATYEAVRAAGAAKLAVKAGQAPTGLSLALKLMGEAVLRVYLGAADLGLKLPMADAVKLMQETSK